MSLTVAEFCAVNDVLDYILRERKAAWTTPPTVAKALALLADHAYAKLYAGWDGDGVKHAVKEPGD